MKTANNDLMAALQTLTALDVNGRSLADRLQFSDAGRALLDQCRAALDASMHAEWCASFAVPFNSSKTKATCDCFMQRKTPMNKILIDRAVVQQALHVATAAGYPVALIATLKAALEQPYAEQARRVEQETHGRMRIDPVTGNVSIGTPTEQPVQELKPFNGLTKEEALAWARGLRADSLEYCSCGDRLKDQCPAASGEG